MSNKAFIKNCRCGFGGCGQRVLKKDALWEMWDPVTLQVNPRGGTTSWDILGSASHTVTLVAR